SPVPRAAASDATHEPWLRVCASAPSGVRPSALPTPEKSAPPAIAPSSSLMPPATPLSMTAMVVPLPLVVSHASSMPSSSSQYCELRIGSGVGVGVGVGLFDVLGVGDGDGVSVVAIAAAEPNMRAHVVSSAAVTALTRRAPRRMLRRRRSGLRLRDPDTRNARAT